MLFCVLDTNILASATIQESGVPARIIKAWLEGKFHLIVSDKLIDEARRVLFYERVRKYSHWTDVEVYEFLEILERTAIKVKGELQLQVIEADPDDDKFIIAAMEGGADYIVSGDSHLKELKEYQGIKIVTPAQFVRILENLES